MIIAERTGFVGVSAVRSGQCGQCTYAQGGLLVVGAGVKSLLTDSCCGSILRSAKTTLTAVGSGMELLLGIITAVSSSVESTYERIGTRTKNWLERFQTVRGYCTNATIQRVLIQTICF